MVSTYEQAEKHSTIQLYIISSLNAQATATVKPILQRGHKALDFAHTKRQYQIGKLTKDHVLEITHVQFYIFKDFHNFQRHCSSCCAHFKLSYTHASSMQSKTEVAETDEAALDVQSEQFINNTLHFMSLSPEIKVNSDNKVNFVYSFVFIFVPAINELQE